MENEEILKILGLRQDEAKIYAALLGSEPETVSGIAKLTGLHRPAIYRLLPRLVERGLVSAVPRGKQKRFGAESPEKLKILLDEAAQDLAAAMPGLLAAFRVHGKKPVVKFLEGRSGIMSVLSDLVHSMKRGEIFYRYSSPRDARKSSRYLPHDYRTIRDQKQLQRFVIANEHSMVGKKPRLERAVKFIPKKYGLFEHDIAQIIYGDKVAFLDYNTETAIVIENQIIAEFQKKIFKLLYDLLPNSEWS